MKEFTIQRNEAGQRLDKYLAKRLSRAPKSFFYKMMRKKNITLNKKKAEGKEILSEGDRVQFFLADDTFEKFSGSSEIRRADVPLDILYEDEHVLLINKAAGVLSQPDGSGTDSMSEYVTGYLLRSGALSETDLETFHPGVCNRLDRNTTGIITAGKSLTGLQKLSGLFHDRDLHKYYLCICFGVIDRPAHLKGYLMKNEKTNRVEITEEASGKGERIETRYRPLGSNGRETLLEVELLTGKPHQIRAHLSSAGHAILGDMKYISREEERIFSVKLGLKYQLLHAYRLVFPCLGGPLEGLSEKRIDAPVPEQFMEILKQLKLEEYYGR